MNLQKSTLWKRVDKEPAPESVLVRTISENGLERTLFRRGRLWFVSDGSMYVYYTPLLWRELTESEKSRL